MTQYKNRILCGDSAQILKTLPDNLVDLTVTSPPYDDLRSYNGYTFDFETIAKELYRVTKEGGVVVWVVGDSIKNGSETLTSFKQALYFKEIGFNVHDTMIYSKNMRFPENIRYNQVFEYMFVLSKGKPKSINLIRDKKNKWFGSTAGCYNRNKQTGESEKNPRTEINRFGTRNNIWFYETGFLKTSKDKVSFEHPATFPEELAADHILSWSNEGDLVLDPFAGSGTTLKMARLLRRDYLGIEISQKYIDIINKRLEKHNNQPLETWLTG